MSALAPESEARLHRLLEGAGVDGLLVLAESAHDCDVAPFVGEAHLGDCFVLVPAGRPAVLGYFTDMERDEAATTGLELLTPSRLGVPSLRQAGRSGAELWRQVVAAAFAELGVAGGAWALAGRPPAGYVVAIHDQLAGGWRWRDGRDLARRWRKHKPVEWLARIERPAEGVCAAMRRVASMLAASEPRGGDLWWEGAPLTAGALRRAVSRELAEAELSQPHGNIVACGAAAATPHTQGSSRHVLRAGEPVVVDLYPARGLFADCTRTFCVGEPPPGFAAAHEAVAEALAAGHRACRPGARGWELQTTVCDLFEARGYATLRSDPATRVGYVHGLGHGVGFELHEEPSFGEHAGEEGVLEAGDLLTLEPGLYDEAAGWGVRLEDLCYLAGDECRNLTPLPYAWDPAAWT